MRKFLLVLAILFVPVSGQASAVKSALPDAKLRGAALPLRDQLEQCLDDVQKGDSYVAVSQGKNRVGFRLNGKQTCTLSHPQIKTRFMSIFLGESTRSGGVTRKLRGA